MRNRWSETDAAGLDGVDLLVYMSRLVGADPALVVWGGGNTSLKLEETDFRGRATSVLRVKGSGSDLKSVGKSDFTGVRIEDVLPLEAHAQMSDEEMVDYLAHTLMEPGSPRPSIETLLHAFIPSACVLHSHADAVVALSNTEQGGEIVQRALGAAAIQVPYRRPGFILSKEVAEAARGSANCVVLMNHGLVTWADSAKDAYDLHIEIVSKAEAYATGKHAGRRSFGGAVVQAIPEEERRATAALVAPRLRGLLSSRQRVVLRYDDSPDVLEFVAGAEAERLSQVGPATPDHLLNTKRLPVYLRVPDPTDVPAVARALEQRLVDYRDQYDQYVIRNNTDRLEPLAAEPRVILVSGLGMWSCGRDARAALIAGDIYHHTISVMSSAEAVGSYRSLTERVAFEAEYWPLELFKLTLQPAERPLARRVALVTGAGSGIGRAIAQRFAAEGAHVAVADIDGEAAQRVGGQLASEFGGRALGLELDVRNESQVTSAFRAVCLAFGGLDILVSNAGIAPSGALTDTSLRDWEASMAVNATGHFLVTREALRLMKAQAIGGSLVYIASKNVPAPGGEFGAYSAAKAAEAQLARVAAIEGGPHGIRANIVNPDAVFEGSRLFSAELRAQRARSHGVEPVELEEFYRRRNLLQVRVFAEDVAETALFLAGDRSAKTTGAMLPVDGGLREAFPR